VGSGNAPVGSVSPDRPRRIGHRLVPGVHEPLRLERAHVESAADCTVFRALGLVTPGQAAVERRSPARRSFRRLHIANASLTLQHGASRLIRGEPPQRAGTDPPLSNAAIGTSDGARRLLILGLRGECWLAALGSPTSSGQGGRRSPNEAARVLLDQRCRGRRRLGRVRSRRRSAGGIVLPSSL